jgi:hypothetical protein
MGIAALVQQDENIWNGFVKQRGYAEAGLAQYGVTDFTNFEKANSDPFSAKREGGNFDFANAGFDFGCPHEGRCTNALDFSHGGGLFHRDTADPFIFPGGTLLHLFVDYIFGNLVDVIPR